VDVALTSDPSLLLQVTLTRFDVGLVQDLAVAVEA
jgi:hypothetical protein